MNDELEWMTVAQLVFYHTILSVYRIRKSGEPERLAEKFTHENFRGNLIVPNTRLSIVKNSFAFRGAYGWSSLPVSLRTVNKIDEFKKELRSYTLLNIPRFVSSI